MTGLTNEQSNVVIGIILILSVIMRHFKLHQFLAGKRQSLHKGKCHEEKTRDCIDRMYLPNWFNSLFQSNGR